MKHRRKFAYSAIVVVGLCIVLASLMAAEKKTPPPAEVKDIVELVSNSLAKACTTDENNKTICETLTDVTLTLHTEIDKDGKIGVSIFGISLGGHREKDTYNEFAVTLKRPEAEAALSSAERLKVSDGLVQAFKSYLQAKAAAEKGQYALRATGFYLELGFTVQKGINGDTSGLTLIPISPDISGKVEKKDVQTIRFSFGK